MWNSFGMLGLQSFACSCQASSSGAKAAGKVEGIVLKWHPPILSRLWTHHVCLWDWLTTYNPRNLPYYVCNLATTRSAVRTSSMISPWVEVSDGNTFPLFSLQDIADAGVRHGPRALPPRHADLPPENCQLWVEVYGREGISNWQVNWYLVVCRFWH